MEGGLGAGARVVPEPPQSKMGWGWGNGPPLVSVEVHACSGNLGAGWGFQKPGCFEWFFGLRTQWPEDQRVAILVAVWGEA